MRSFIRVIAWANHGEFTTTAHFSTANRRVKIVQLSYETNLTSDNHGYGG